MKKYIRSTKYTVTYDDEKVQYAADYLKAYLMSMTKERLKPLTESAYGYEGGRVVRSKLAEDINRYFMSKPNVFKIDVNGKVEHAHGIGNNNKYQLLLLGTKGNPSDVICGYIYINAGFYCDVYLGIKDLDGNKVGSSFELGTSGYLAIDGKTVKRF